MLTAEVTQLPSSRTLEAERALIGALLLEPGAFDRVADIVTSRYFDRPAHSLIFSVIGELVGRDQAVDQVTIVDALERRGALEAVGGSEYLARLLEETPSAANARAYAGMVRDAATLRDFAERSKHVQSAEDLQGLAEWIGTSVAGAGTAALCKLEDLGIASFLDADPPPRVWLLDRILPLGVVGLIAAGGGTGKSYVMLQLAVSIATGRAFLGIPVSDAGAVLLICAEDERDELHRRLSRIIERMREVGEFGEAEDELLRERLFIASRVGEDNLMTTVVDGAATKTTLAERIALLAEQVPALKLIGLDPVSRFRGGNENDNEAATRFVEVIEKLRAATGASVLMAHHMSKEGLRAGADRLTPEALRGASALLDAVRWAAAMGTLRKDAAEDYDVAPEDAAKFVRLDVVKSSYAAPWEGLWLERLPGGVLVPTDLEYAPRKRRKEEQDEDRYHEILPKLQGLIRQYQEKGEPLTRTRLRDFAGKSGLFGIGDHALRSIVERALAEGQISEHDSGDKRRGKELRTWK